MLCVLGFDNASLGAHTWQAAEDLLIRRRAKCGGEAEGALGTRTQVENTVPSKGQADRAWGTCWEGGGATYDAERPAGGLKKG
jgi:hypothetical protein